MYNYKNATSSKKINLAGLEILRDLTIGEYNAVDSYRYHIQQSNNEKLNEILQEILSDEERHIKMLNHIIRKYDPKQDEFFIKANEELPVIHNLNNDYVSSDYNIVHSLIEEINSETTAISQYANSCHFFNIPEIRNTLLELMNDEKQHLAELTKILNDII